MQAHNPFDFCHSHALSKQFLAATKKFTLIGTQNFEAFQEHLV